MIPGSGLQIRTRERGATKNYLDKWLQKNVKIYKTRQSFWRLKKFQKYLIDCMGNFFDFSHLAVFRSIQFFIFCMIFLPVEKKMEANSSGNILYQIFFIKLFCKIQDYVQHNGLNFEQKSMLSVRKISKFETFEIFFIGNTIYRKWIRIRPLSTVVK